MTLVYELSKTIGCVAACRTLQISRASFYRYSSAKRQIEVNVKRVYRRLTDAEQVKILCILVSDQYMDQSPYQVYADLLSKGEYHCSVSTMYRILRAQNLVHERRQQRVRAKYAAPILEARRPNQVWSWDITVMRGTAPHEFFYLYSMLDIYSRYVVGWMVHDRQETAAGQTLFFETCKNYKLDPRHLVLHSDRGAQMKGRTWRQFEQDLGIQLSYSRPRTSNDNPFIESSFKTMKSRPSYPSHFTSTEDARGYLQTYMRWYNTEHYHSSICYLTPKSVHFGASEGDLISRQSVLDASYAANPHRFANGRPTTGRLPEVVGINRHLLEAGSP